MKSALFLSLICTTLFAVEPPKPAPSAHPTNESAPIFDVEANKVVPVPTETPKPPKPAPSPRKTKKPGASR